MGTNGGALESRVTRFCPRRAVVFTASDVVEEAEKVGNEAECEGPAAVKVAECEIAPW